MNTLDPDHEQYFQDQLSLAGGNAEVLARDLLQRLILVLKAGEEKPDRRKRGRPPGPVRGIYVPVSYRKAKHPHAGKPLTLPWPDGKTRKVLISERNDLRKQFPDLSIEVVSWMTLLPYGVAYSRNFALVDDLKKR